MSIQVTLTFASEAELVKYFAAGAVSAPAVTAKPETVAKKETAAPKAEKPKAEPKEEVVHEKPEPAATQETASTTASTAPSVDYPTLQKAVFALANAKGRDAVVNLLKDQFKVNSAKELTPEQYADALAAVTAATEA